MLLCWISRFITTRGMQYPTRPRAEWNITIPRVVINLISNTVKVQYRRSGNFCCENFSSVAYAVKIEHVKIKYMYMCYIAEPSGGERFLMWSTILVLLYSLYACVQNCVRALKSETMYSHIKESATVTVQTWLAPACIPEWWHCLQVKGLVSLADVRLVACSCLWVNVRDWLVPSLSNNDTRLIFRWRSNNDAAFGIPSFESMHCR